MDISLSKFQEMVKDREAWHAAVQGVTKSWTLLSNWNTVTKKARIGDNGRCQENAKFIKVLLTIRNYLYNYYLSKWGCVLFVSQSCPTLCNTTDCSPPGSTAHGILQARILDWLAIPFSRGSSWPRDQTLVSSIAGSFFYHLSYKVLSEAVSWC